MIFVLLVFFPAPSATWFALAFSVWLPSATVWRKTKGLGHVSLDLQSLQVSCRPCRKEVAVRNNTGNSECLGKQCGSLTASANNVAPIPTNSGFVALGEQNLAKVGRTCLGRLAEVSRRIELARIPNIYRVRRFRQSSKNAPSPELQKDSV